MATPVRITPNKTYKTLANMLKSIADAPDMIDGREVHYLVCQTEEGRYYPVFIGMHTFQMCLVKGWCMTA